MRHVECIAPWCSVCHRIYVLRAGLRLSTSEREFAWYPDCKCKKRVAEVAVDDDGEQRYFSLDNLAPRQRARPPKEE